MSQIFDALQRSEAERSGNDAAAPRVTELLQRTESYVASRPETADARQPEDFAKGVKRDWSVEAHTESSAVVAAERENGKATALLVADERIETTLKLQSVQVSISPDPQSRLVCLPGIESPATEAFHLLGVRLRHLRRGRLLKKVLITSTIPQEGKSMVAANLACTLALRTQQKVLLIDGDVRRPTQSKIFGIGNKQGICECLRGDQGLAASIYQLEGLGLWILPAGNASNNSLELLQSGRLSPLMDQLNAWFDWIIIDSPPVLPLADTSVWTNLADGILLVTRQGTTQKRLLEKGLEVLGSQKLIGALLNSSKGIVKSDYYYGPASRLPTDE
jgi:capsular exopolysaccharide synthesis family protein